MASIQAVEAKQSQFSRLNSVALFIGLTAGFLLRLRLAWMTFLNPDEALHYFLAHQPSLKLAYKASLTTAHPPLMILFLHYWSLFGSSEFFLRLPFVVAGTLFCWVMFLWIREIGSQCAAWFALALSLFSPPLILLSAEIRQYAVVLLFCVCCIYFLERALDENSVRSMALSAFFLWLALLSHYSALIFAASVGVYALLRILQKNQPAVVTAVWIAGQIIALAICAFLFESQISRLRQIGVPSEIAATWLRGSIFHRGEDHLLIFTWSRSLRLFRYFFSNGTIGLLALLLFLSAILLMLSRSQQSERRLNRPTLAPLLLLPFLITLGTAITGIYPYGGTRHDVLLALFAIPGIAIGLDYIPLGSTAISKWLKPVLLGCALIIGNLFPSPTGPYIRPRNQRRELMSQAINSLRALPPNSLIFTDDQGSVVLNYYLCDERLPLPFLSTTGRLLNFRCGDHIIVIATKTPAGFDRSVFPALIAEMQGELYPEATINLFQSGWIDDKEQRWLSELRSTGGDPNNFGPNILVCPIRPTASSPRFIE